jgi:hypothetical protein
MNMFMDVLSEVVHEQCPACKMWDLSQRHHDCMLLPGASQCRKYFDIVLERLSESNVLYPHYDPASITDTVNNFKLKSEDILWKQSLFCAVLQRLEAKKQQ